MANEESTTLQNILAAGKEEFLEKGFKSASLRNIVKTAGVTTGAFYGYFSGKEALFAALVEEHATAIMNIFMSAQEDFEMLDEKDKANHMGIESRKSINSIIDYIYEHFDEFKLIICKSEGTCYENFVHKYRFTDLTVVDNGEFWSDLCETVSKAKKQLILAKKKEGMVEDVEDAYNEFEAAYNQYHRVYEIIENSYRHLIKLKRKTFWKVAISVLAWIIPLVLSIVLFFLG